MPETHRSDAAQGRSEGTEVSVSTLLPDPMEHRMALRGDAAIPMPGGGRRQSPPGLASAPEKSANESCDLASERGPAALLLAGESARPYIWSGVVRAIESNRHSYTRKPVPTPAQAHQSVYMDRSRRKEVPLSGYRRLSAPRAVTQSELTRLESYVPKVVPESRWLPIRPYVLATAEQLGAWSNGDLMHWVSVLTKYVDFTHHVYGLPLEHVRIFDRDMIQHYTESVITQMSSGSRGAVRSRLFWMADHLVPHDGRSRVVTSLQRTAVSAPYTEQEIRILKRWARMQRTPYMRHAMMSVLTFGLGAGLKAPELCALRAEDVVQDEHGVLVNVRGRQARTVPVLREWEHSAAVLAESVEPDQYVFRSQRVSSKREPGASIGHSMQLPDFPVTMKRMRTTWQVALLNRAVPLNVIAAASGLQGLTGLERLLPFLDEVPFDEARAQLRGFYRAKDRRKRGLA